MTFDQPCNELRIGLTNGVLAAEAQCIHFAECRMVAAAPLCDVMKQSGKIEQLRTIEVAHEAAA